MSLASCMVSYVGVLSSVKMTPTGHPCITFVVDSARWYPQSGRPPDPPYPSLLSHQYQSWGKDVVFRSQIQVPVSKSQIPWLAQYSFSLSPFPSEKVIGVKSPPPSRTELMNVNPGRLPYGHRTAMTVFTSAAESHSVEAPSIVTLRDVRSPYTDVDPSVSRFLSAVSISDALAPVEIVDVVASS